MKKLLGLLFCVTIILCLSNCTFCPPEGYTEEHHTYEEILEFALAIDPNATVSEEYTDTTIEDWDREFREFPAVIHGIECHVSSVGDMVWNSGFLAGEFARQYYVVDTDYDYLALKQIVSAHNPDWSISEDTLGHRYNWNNVLSIYIKASSTEPMTDEELDIAWETAKEIYVAYNDLPIRKSLYFWLPAPRKKVTYKGEESVIRNSSVLIENFTEADKLAFVDEYHEAWALLESGLPIND